MPYVTLKNGNRIEARDEFTGESKGLEFDVENRQLKADFGDGSEPASIGGLTPEQSAELDQAVADIAQLKTDVARAESKADIAGEVANTKLDNSIQSHTEGMVPVANDQGQLVDNYITNANVASNAAIESSKLAFTSAQSSALASGIDATKVAQIQQNSDDIDLVEAKATHADAEAERIGKLIPNEATIANKLADKAFVNSTVATNTANFIGTFNSLADLEAYSGTVTNNDYAFVITGSGSNTVYNRYKYTDAATPASWIFEYALNNSSFTAAQWATINSGATSGTVAQVASNQTAIVSLQTDVAGKADASALAAAEASALTDTNTVINAVNARPEVVNYDLSFSTGAWAANTDSATSGTYPYKATAYFDTAVMPLASANSYSGIVNFSAADVVSGKFAPFCEVAKSDVTVDDANYNRWTFTIYATESASATVATRAVLLLSTLAINEINVNV